MYVAVSELGDVLQSRKAGLVSLRYEQQQGVVHTRDEQHREQTEPATEIALDLGGTW